MEQSSENSLGKPCFSSAGWALFASQVVPASVILLTRLWMPDLPPEMLKNNLILWALSYIPVYGIGLPLGMGLLSRLPGDPMPSCKMSWKAFFVAFIMCYPLMLGGSILGNLLAGLLSGGRAVNNVAEVIARRDPLMIVTMIVIAPVMEELFFRKFLMDHTARFGEKNAVFFSALAFGLFHCNLYQIFYAFGIGLIFGYVYLRTRNVKYTMAMHFLVNFLSGVVAAGLMSRVNPQVMDLMVRGDEGGLLQALEAIDPEKLISLYVSLAPLLLYNFLVFALAVGGIVLLGIKKQNFFFREKQMELPVGRRFRTMILNPGFLFFFFLCLGVTILNLIECCP